jgi:UDP-N-acetylglucosamine 1-carboxyvinyltransferase
LLKIFFIKNEIFVKVFYMYEYIMIEHSPALRGQLELEGAKNAVLVIMASLILTSGKSRLTNVPASSDVYTMISLLQELGAEVIFDAEHKILDVDTTLLCRWRVSPEIIKKIRASILVMGALLGRFGKVEVAMPGGDAIGSRPIDLHLKAFAKMGAIIDRSGECIAAYATSLRPIRYILDYPSVGATENVLMAAVLTQGTTEILNAALEPEVLDLIAVLQKMGANISLHMPATIRIEGVRELQPIEHSIMYDRLEAGTLLLAVAATGGELHLPQAPAASMEVFLEKMVDMGHSITVGKNGYGVSLKATQEPKAISFKTMPYPGYPTDLQAPMLAALSVARGISVVHETVYESRMLHVQELQKMGAHIDLRAETASIKGVSMLYGTHVIGHDIRAAAALVVAGLMAQGTTIITGLHHIRRGYHGLDKKLQMLGAKIKYVQAENELILQDASSKIGQLTGN